MIALNFSYDKKLFIQPPSDQFECPICLNIMEDPVQCPEGHTFCRHCISRYLDGDATLPIHHNTFTCPTCRGLLTKKTLVPNRLICSLIEDLEVRCFSYQPEEENSIELTHENEGNVVESCEWSGKLRDVETHYSECQFANTTCPHDDCDEILVKKDLPEHLMNCLHRSISCEFCGLIATIDLIHSHSSECPKRPEPCPNGCFAANGDILCICHDQIGPHCTICIMEEVGCTFAVTGCNVRCSRKDMLFHEKDAGAHIVGLLDAHRLALAQANDLSIQVCCLNRVVAEQHQAKMILDGKCATKISNLSVQICELDRVVMEQNLKLNGQAKTIKYLECVTHPTQLIFKIRPDTISIKGVLCDTIYPIPNSNINDLDSYLSLRLTGDKNRNIGFYLYYSYEDDDEVNPRDMKAVIEIVSYSALCSTKKKAFITLPKMTYESCERSVGWGSHNLMTIEDSKKEEYLKNGIMTIKAKITICSEF